MMQFGVQSDELTRRNMEMFATEVTPHFTRVGVHRQACLVSESASTREARSHVTILCAEAGDC